MKFLITMDIINNKLDKNVGRSVKMEFYSVIWKVDVKVCINVVRVLVYNKNIVNVFIF